MVRKRRRRQDPSGNLDTQLGSPAGPRVFKGGRFQPLGELDLTRIVEHAYATLARVGLAEVPDWLFSLCQTQGASKRHDGRVVFPATSIDRAISRAAKIISLPGMDERHSLQVGGGNVHIGTGGAAVHVLDTRSGQYRDSTLNDLYDIMRVVDACEHVHYGVRPLIARDVETPFELDINTAYTCMRATSKPIGVSFHSADHVAPVCHLFDMALGAENAFRERPFCMAIIVHVVPPLAFAPEGVDIMRAAIESGMTLQICSAGQAGATSPASLAGALAQGLAESLAGLMVVDAIKPGHPCIFAFMPFISDLRTGAMTGGGGEAAIASAAAAQLLLHLGLPSTACAGMTDAKLADVQAGYEKGYTVVLAAQAGADMINLSVGMLGSILVASPEALLIDDDMCAAILRTVRGIEVDESLLDLDITERVVTGEGHFLGESQTLGLMRSEYVYPTLGDRQSLDEWLAAGSPSIWDKARERVRAVLNTQSSDFIPSGVDRAIRNRFPIKLREDL